MKTNEMLNLIGDKDFLDKMYPFSYRRCNTSHEAEDLCSDIILAVISAVYSQDSVDNFYAFAWTIARRVYADYSENQSHVYFLPISRYHNTDLKFSLDFKNAQE